MNRAPIWILISTLVLFQSQILWARGDKSVIVNRGSDSMAIAVLAWAENYQISRHKVGIAVSGGGSGTGIAALTNGAVNIANASRPMSEREIERARKRGIEPVEHLVGHDAVAIYVHRDNPIRSLSPAQLKEIFGAGGHVERWSDLGIEVPGCSDQKIIRVSRQSSSGTYALLRKTLLGGKRYKLGTRESQSSKDLVTLIGSTPCAIGYSSYAFLVPEVRAVCIAGDSSERCISPSIAAVTDQTYPLSRPLFMYTNGQPRGHVKDYLDWVLSDEGQCILIQRQYAPVRKVACGG